MTKIGRQVPATNNYQWIIIIGISILSTILSIFWKEETLLLEHRVIIVVACVLLTAYSLCHAAYSVTLSSHGLVCFWFGKEILSYQWEQIEEISIIRDYKLNLRSSGKVRIVVTPKGCPVYNRNKWCGIHYVFLFRKQVIWMDNTSTNQKYIQEKFGEIIDCR